MAKIRFKNGKVEDYTIILSNRSHQYYGQLTGVKGVSYSGNLNSANEISFTVYKHKLVPDNNIPYKDIESFQNYIWNNLVDLKLIFVKELEEYFQIKVSVDDANDTIKTITATSQCEAELSQIMLYNIEINTEDDIARDDYEVTIFYNSENPNASLLHRVLNDKAPHYTIAHVDKSLCNLQRTFSIDGTSIYDFMIGECSEQFDCLFQFDSVNRTVSVYDLLTVCEECGERGDFNDVCPKCGSKKLKYFGQDTTIYVDKNNLTDSIHFEVDSDSIKNCFKLEGGDDVMTAAIRALNPTGTDYLYIQRQEDLAEMPQELANALSEYNVLYNKSIEPYRELTGQIYDLTDDILYYKSSMMPKVDYVNDLDEIKELKEGYIYIYNDTVYLYDGEHLSPTDENAEFYTDLIPSSDLITAETEAGKLTVEALSPIAISKITKGSSIATVESALKNYAKVLVKSGYVKVEIEKKDKDDADFTFNVNLDEDGELAVDENGCHSGEWRGRFKVTNYSDEEDIAYTDYMTIVVNDNYEEFMRQKIAKDINSNNDDEGSVFNVLAIDDLEQFKCSLKLYSLNRLISFRDAIQSVLDVLIQANQAEEDAELYETFYLTYYERLNVCQDELDIRQDKIESLQEQKDDLQTEQEKIQTSLNLVTYLGDLYPIFCSYRREDKYSNSNYISDGLDNTQLLQRAKEFWEKAQKDLEKSSNGECTITSTLYNLLVIPEFKQLTSSFELGNWIRVRVDGQLYRLRLIGYSINFDSLQTINVTFSTITKVQNAKTERESIIQTAQQMATGINIISKQAEQGQEANNSISSVFENGLNSGLIQIKNNDKEEVTYGKYGLLLRAYDDILDDYEDKQLKLTHNTIAFTDNNWKSVKTVIGENTYMSYNPSDNKWEQLVGYGLTSQYVMSGVIYGENEIIGGMIRSKNYSDGKTLDKDGNVLAKGGSYIDLNTGEFSFGGDNLYYRDGEFVINETVLGQTLEAIDIKAENLHIDAGNIDGTLKNTININDTFLVDSNGNVTLPESTTLSWEQITNAPDIISNADISNAIKETVTSEYVSSLEKLTLNNVSSIKTSDLYFNTSYIFNPDTNDYETGVTGTYTIGDVSLRIINGIIVDVQ